MQGANQLTIAVIYGGSRQNGNTDVLTEKAVQGLAVEKIYLKDYVIQPIEDLRHTPEGFQKIDDDHDHIMDRMLRHDILVFSTPIYWYSMSGTMKNFIDRWSQTMRDPRYPDLKNRMSEKTAYVITVGGDEPILKGLPMIQQFGHIFDFIGIPFAGYVIGTANKPGEILQDETALIAANQLRHTLISHDH